MSSALLGAAPRRGACGLRRTRLSTLGAAPGRILGGGLLVGALLLPAACDGGRSPTSAAGETSVADRVLRLAGETMGTTWMALYVSPEPASADRQQEVDALSGAIRAELDRVDQVFSTWNPDAEISRLNRQPAGQQAVSDEFAQVLDLALRLAVATDGAYDPTLQPALANFGFTGGVGSDDEAAADRPGVGHAAVRLDVDASGSALLVRSEPRAFELSSVAKGWGVECLAAVFETAGIDAYFVEIGGEVQARGSKPGGVPWVVGIEQPPVEPVRAVDLARRAVHARLRLRDRAVATSGSYRNFVQRGADWTHHVLDARTLRNPEHRAVAVSVQAPGCALADGLATALLIVGPDGAQQVLEAFGTVGVDVAALFLVAPAPSAGNPSTEAPPAETAATETAAGAVVERTFGWAELAASGPR